MNKGTNLTLVILGSMISVLNIGLILRSINNGASTTTIIHYALIAILWLIMVVWNLKWYIDRK